MESLPLEPAKRATENAAKFLLPASRAHPRIPVGSSELGGIARSWREAGSERNPPPTLTHAVMWSILAPMGATIYQDIRDSLRQLYLEDERPWLVGFSGGKDSTMLASLVFDAVLSIPAAQRKKPVSVLCTDTRVEIPAIAGMVEGTLDRMRKCSEQHDLNIDANLLKPTIEESFWVNIIGRGYLPPNRVFRWCTQRMKVDPVNVFVQQRLGHWGEAILHLGARRAESSTRAQTMAGRETRNGLRRHRDLPRVWVSNPIEFLATEEVWAYLLQKPNPWGGDNRRLYKLYASASSGECPIQIDTSTPSCGNSRFGKRDKLRMNGNKGPGSSSFHYHFLPS